jgi:hypothetical protein
MLRYFSYLVILAASVLAQAATAATYDNKAKHYVFPSLPKSAIYRGSLLNPELSVARYR